MVFVLPKYVDLTECEIKIPAMYVGASASKAASKAGAYGGSEAGAALGSLVGPPVIGGIVGNIVGERVGQDLIRETGLDRYCAFHGDAPFSFLVRSEESQPYFRASVPSIL